MKRESAARANAKLRNLVGLVHRAVDAHHAKQVPTSPLPVQCASGCASAARGCCALMTVVERAEVEHLVARNPEAVARALPKLEAASARIAEAIPPEMIGACFKSEYAEKHAASAYHALYVTCPFLGDDHRCTVYADRPLACRTHLVLSPPELCELCGENSNHWILDAGTRLTAQASFLRGLEENGRPMSRWQFGTLPQLALAVARGDAPVPTFPSADLPMSY